MIPHCRYSRSMGHWSSWDYFGIYGKNGIGDTLQVQAGMWDTVRWEVLKELIWTGQSDTLVAHLSCYWFMSAGARSSEGLSFYYSYYRFWKTSSTKITHANEAGLKRASGDTFPYKWSWTSNVISCGQYLMNSAHSSSHSSLMKTIYKNNKIIYSIWKCRKQLLFLYYLQRFHWLFIRNLSS